MNDENQVLDLDSRLDSDKDDSGTDFDMGKHRPVDGPVDLETMKDPFFVSENHENVDKYCRAMQEGKIPDPYDPTTYK